MGEGPRSDTREHLDPFGSTTGVDVRVMPFPREGHSFSRHPSLVSSKEHGTSVPSLDMENIAESRLDRSVMSLKN